MHAASSHPPSPFNSDTACPLHPFGSAFPIISTSPATAPQQHRIRLPVTSPHMFIDKRADTSCLAAVNSKYGLLTSWIACPVKSEAPPEIRPTYAVSLNGLGDVQ